MTNKQGLFLPHDEGAEPQSATGADNDPGSAKPEFADISALQTQQKVMVEELGLARRIFDSVCNGITICDSTLPDMPLVYVNLAFEKMTGYSAAESVGRNCRFLQGQNRKQSGLDKIREAIGLQRDARVLLRNYHKDGSPFWNELYMSPIFGHSGQLTHFVGIQNDVTRLVEAQERLTYLAGHDALTGLVNRMLLMEYLEKTLSRARRHSAQVAVLFFDLDHFKYVNDMFGHETGDRLLEEVARRLTSGTRTGETVARLGGDEFIVVLEELTEQRQPHLVKERLVRLIAEPVEMQGQAFCAAASVGMAIFPQDGEMAEELIKVADFRMYAAKHESRLAEQSPDETQNEASAKRRPTEGGNNSLY